MRRSSSCKPATTAKVKMIYIDPESRRIRQYYPDFFAEMSDGTYELIEVKGDDKIEDSVVIAKAEAAREMAVASGVEYKMYAGSVIMKSRILETVDSAYQASLID
ncbi:MAG: Tn7 transposase TnsA N-terminal domain-containing protein [Oscillospiraceae bacterium]|nr:Tn7 transposase TnsA N-terminal domain-containing protein [Oscillospiraceae bacterium]